MSCRKLLELRRQGGGGGGGGGRREGEGQEGLKALGRRALPGV